MSQDFLRPELDTLTTELLDNRRCRELITELNDFENMVFGPDFACECTQIQPWVDSNCLFYSAVTGEAVPGQRRILSVLSLFITSSASRDRMLRGEIADFELTPWTVGPASDQPTIYLSSVVSAAPHHLAAMYESLLRDIQEFRDLNSLVFHSGFAIATGAAGRRHMAKSGFCVLEGCRYRAAYDLMVIDAQRAETPFWCQLLNAETTFLRRPSWMAGNDPVKAAASAQTSLDAQAREVEKRLAEAKADRLRQKLDF